MKDLDTDRLIPMIDFINGHSCFFSKDASSRCLLESQVRLSGLEMVVQFDRVIELPVEMRRSKISSLFAETKK